MKLYLIIVLCVCSSFNAFSQNHAQITPADRTGHLFFYWGWNWDSYSKSDITFEGTDYNFTLDNVAAHHMPKRFSFNNYFNPAVATIPQYNFRIGYFFSNHYALTIGTDHMKYVMTTDQYAKITGTIANSGTDYDGMYSDDDIQLRKDFLQFEHTDGLNYANIDLRRMDEIWAFHSIKFNLTEGLGGGILIPKTNTTLLSMDRYDEFHLSGYGVSGFVGLNVEFLKHFFLQSEFKTGYINMPDIRTTKSESDSASQDFFFYQLNFVFGATIHLKQKAK